ncbi:ATP-binding protein [uncultured Sphaerochaeta sp.]|uniref:ATP-binding protein n=1 Tax=uncultured Sphaerochaeta sp. TaxID=886478 RepID=UPI002A0A5B9F|nr:ATP-binding protein [uncultured Sphaerochaeta sp.]
MHEEFTVPAKDFSVAGVASSKIKRLLKQLDIPPHKIKQIIVATFEAEVNVIAHSYGGKLVCDIEEDSVLIQAIDIGPGIENLELAMTDGWSTATEEVRELGYGAGMGMSNIKKNCDKLDIYTKAGDHTRVSMYFKLEVQS